MTILVTVTETEYAKVWRDTVRADDSIRAAAHRIELAAEQLLAPLFPNATATLRPRGL